jgi:restriction endonuclease S subunit
MAAGSVVKNLNKELVGKLRVPVPDMAMQTAFATFIEQSDKSKFELQKALDELTAMQKKLMLNIFSEQ